MGSNEFRCGFISVIGLANTGKSTLLNKILGQKLLPVSVKAQMTRSNVKAIYSTDDFQMVFLDTPGFHVSKKLINQYFINQTLDAIKASNIIIFLIKADEKSSDIKDNKELLDELRKSNKKIIYCVSKADLLKKKAINYLASFIKNKKIEYGINEDIIELSVKDNSSIKFLINKIYKLLPISPPLYDIDYLTDKSTRDVVSEIIREKVFLFTNDEIPYSCAVEVVKYLEKEHIDSIYVNILVERNSQKVILLGKGGTMIKKIGTRSRLDIEKMLGKKVYLELFVKVKPNWTKDKRSLKELGYV